MDTQTQEETAREAAMLQQLATQHVLREERAVERDEEWSTFDAREIAESELLACLSSRGSFEGDEHTRRFLKFLSAATNFSSHKFAEKMEKIPELVEQLKMLIADMIREAKEYSDIANEVHELIRCFVNLVHSIQHQAQLVLPVIDETQRQMSVIEDILTGREDSTKAVTEVDKKDMDLAIGHMSVGIDRLIETAVSSAEQSRLLGDRIAQVQNKVGSKRVDVRGRVDIVEFCCKCALSGSPAATIAAAEAAIASSAFGGAGLFVINGVAFPPIGAIISAVVLGTICTASVITLVKKFWINRQLQALGYLNKIFATLVKLNDANENFLRSTRNSEGKVRKLKLRMQTVTLCLESERQRRWNSDSCKRAKEAAVEVMASLHQIAQIDLSDWTTGGLFRETSDTKAVVFAQAELGFAAGSRVANRSVLPGAAPV